MIIIGQKRRPSIMSILGPEEGSEAPETGPGELHQIAHELIEGIHSRNVEDVVSALRACFTCMDAQDDTED